MYKSHLRVPFPNQSISDSSDSSDSSDYSDYSDYSDSSDYYAESVVKVK